MTIVSKIPLIFLNSICKEDFDSVRKEIKTHLGETIWVDEIVYKEDPTKPRDLVIVDRLIQYFVYTIGSILEEQ